MSQVAGYDDVNPMVDAYGDDEMDDQPELDIPSGPGLVNPLLIRRMSQASRGSVISKIFEIFTKYIQLL